MAYELHDSQYLSIMEQDKVCMSNDAKTKDTMRLVKSRDGFGSMFTVQRPAYCDMFLNSVSPQVQAFFSNIYHGFNTLDT